MKAVQSVQVKASEFAESPEKLCFTANAIKIFPPNIKKLETDRIANSSKSQPIVTQQQKASIAQITCSNNELSNVKFQEPYVGATFFTISYLTEPHKAPEILKSKHQAERVFIVRGLLPFSCTREKQTITKPHKRNVIAAYSMPLACFFRKM